MSRSFAIRKKRFWYHFLFWFVHIVFFTMLEGSNNGSFSQLFLFQLLTLPFKIMVVYFVLYYLLPKYLQHRHYFLFFIGLGCSYFLVLAIFHLLNYTFISPIIFNRPNTRPFLSFSPLILWMILTTTYLLILALLIKLTRIWHNNEKSAQQVLNDKLEAELKYLKAQIHPHFLFNTLNNLYTLSLKKSDKAPKAIDKLASLLRYVTYEATQEKVPLYKDIENIKHYISLEKIRYGSRLKIAFEVKGDLKNKQIAPLILLPFVENSFKHGISGELSNSWINISIHIVENSLTMIVENSTAAISNDQMDYTQGIGLKNVKRRLNIIYKDKFHLKVTSAESHLAHLILNLS